MHFKPDQSVSYVPKQLQTVTDLLRGLIQQSVVH